MHSHVADPPEWSIACSESILYFSTYYYYGINNYRLEIYAEFAYRSGDPPAYSLSFQPVFYLHRDAPLNLRNPIGRPNLAFSNPKQIITSIVK
jgi:hypothetical protein